jgi:general secretion pathway protein C
VGVLETLFRKRFFVVHLALSALLAFLLARTVTALVSRVVISKVLASAGGNDGAAPAPRAAQRAAGLVRDFVAAANANIFEGKRDIVIEDGGAAKEVPVDNGDWRNAPKSTLRLRLVGTTAFSEARFSLASIVDESQGGAGAGLYSINECVVVDTSRLTPDDVKLMDKPPPCNKVGDSAIVRRIEPEKVYIFNTSESRIEYLALNEPPGTGDAPSVAMKTEKPEEKSGGDGKDLGDGITKTGENSYGVPRSAVDGALNNLSELATQARIVPAFEGGKPVGFKLFSIKPGSLYSKIGLQNGDVISRINGFEMSSPEKGLEVYQKLKDASNVTVDVKRRGKPMTLDYAIQ